ncbi:aldehyde dehydrogenase family protein [Kitasatospora sp. NPDC051853]|uniref:aldehyde dehydrogenase family protein n=1 Tax=Kitasatospora sp. NPDC051853 TaxID=3364058 RepID=UPI003799E9BB
MTTVEERATAVPAGTAVEVEHYIGGAWVRPRALRPFLRHDPGRSSELVSTHGAADASEVRAAVEAALASRDAWRALGPVRRGEVVRRAAGVLRERREELADAITREQGKLRTEAATEVDRTVALVEYVAGEGRRLGGETLPADDARTLAFTRRAPIGVVGLITPWNFPLAIPAWKIAPALLAGCPVVLKPSPLTPLVTALLVRCFEEAGVPPGVLNLVLGGAATGDALVRDPDVAGVSFTGSVEVGRSIHLAGAPRFLRTQLEMGGKNAALVLADADLPAAADAIAAGAFGQAGQRCSATSRVVVDERVRGRLVELLAERASAIRVGNGFDPEARMGPLVSEKQELACRQAVARARQNGARVVTGDGPLPAGLQGHFVLPTVLDEVERGSFIAQEEVFGPVLSVIGCEGFEDGLAAVNSVRYGMAGAVFTRDQALAWEAVERIEAGMLHVNRPGVGAYPHMPHIGTKESQYGPAECSPHTWDFYTEVRTACVSY